MHLVDRQGVILKSTQKRTTVGARKIAGATVEELLTYPAEARNVRNVISRALDNQIPRYYNYSIGDMNYITLFLPSPMPDIIEAHECQFETWNQRMAAIRRLEKICRKRWSGLGCLFGEKNIG